MLAINHALRSPLTCARLHAELLAGGDKRMALLRDLNTRLQALVDAQFARCGTTLTLDAAVPTLVLDRTRLQLLARNLLDNALRYGARTPVALHSGLANGGVHLRVRDPGPAVAPAQLPHLTEPFYRPDEARSRRTGGIGLGLALCRLVPRSHGSRLDLRNAALDLKVSLWPPLVLPVSTAAATT